LEDSELLHLLLLALAAIVVGISHGYKSPAVWLGTFLFVAFLSLFIPIFH
jgi:hypothetical protein